MNSSFTTLTLPYAAWNTPRLDLITRLRSYCDLVTSPEDLEKQQWVIQALGQISQPVPSSAAALRGLRAHLATLQEVLLDHLLRHSPDVHPLLSASENLLIVNELNSRYTDDSGPLFDAILNSWNEDNDLQSSLDSPATLLANAENSSIIRELVAHTQKSLQWYGPDADEPQSPILWVKLLSHCLALALSPDSDLLGFDFTDDNHSGMTIDEIFAAFDEHLLRNNAATDKRHLVLARYVLRPMFPAAFQISDLPGEMVYRKSSAWVHFFSAVNLTEMLYPGTARHQSLTEILLQPNKVKKNHPDAFVTLFESAASQPVLEWAVANAKIPEQDTEGFSEAALQQAYAAFDARQTQLIERVEGMSAAMPVRFDMAKAELQKHGIDPQLPCHSMQSIQGQGGLRTWDPKTSREAWEVYVSGDSRIWRPLAVPSLHTLGLPDISAKFEKDFDTWLARFETALKGQLVDMLDELPDSERLFIEKSDLELYQVRRASGLTVAADETIGVGHLIGRAGLLLQAVKGGKRRCYELFPLAGVIVRRGELTFHLGGRIHYPPPHDGNPLGSNNHSGWQSGTSETLDWDAYFSPAIPRAEHKSSVIIQQVARLEGSSLALAQLLENLAVLASKEHFLAPASLIRQQARGMTDNESPSWAYRLFKAILPFWQPIENIIQGLKEEKPGLVRQGIGQGLLDLLMVGTRVRQIGTASALTLRQANSLAVRTMMAGLNSGPRAAFISMRLGMRTLKPLLTDLAILTTHSAANTLIPFYGLTLLGIKLLKLTPTALQRLLKALKTVRSGSRRPSYSAGMTRVKPTDSGAYAGKIPGNHLRHVDQHRRVVTRTVSGEGTRYLADVQSGKPYGPKLVEIDDFGKLTIRPPQQLTVQTVGTTAEVAETMPELSKEWVLWGDDLYLKTSDLLYLRIIKSDGTQVLKHVPSSRLPHQKPLARQVSCKTLRDGRGRTLCLIGTGAFPRTHTTGRDTVPWFNDRTISTRSYRYVFNGRSWRLNGSAMKPMREDLVYEHYKAVVDVEVLGGNEVFKAIRIRGGIYNDFGETHTLSAVAAPRRSDGAVFLVTRADPGVYYSGRWTPGQRTALLSKFSPAQPTPMSPGEQDNLALIYAGSYDAHVKILPMPAEQLRTQLETVTKHVANYHGLPQFEVFIGSHFDMGTTPAQAALFCHFTQLRLNQTTRAAAASWQVVNRTTAAADLDDIAIQLNRILKPRQLYDAGLIVNPGRVRVMAGKQNLAYLKLTFNTTPATTSIYYSVSGHAGKGYETKLTRFIKGGNVSDYPNWQRHGEVAVGPDGVRYIDAQPNRSQLKKRKEPFALPDTSTPNKFIESSPNPRMRDSENHIMEKLKIDGIDFETISSAVLYSKLPLCQSCTEVMHKLQSLMRNGSLRVFEGVPARP